MSCGGDNRAGTELRVRRKLWDLAKAQRNRNKPYRASCLSICEARKADESELAEAKGETNQRVAAVSVREGDAGARLRPQDLGDRDRPSAVVLRGNAFWYGGAVADDPWVGRGPSGKQMKEDEGTVPRTGVLLTVANENASNANAAIERENSKRCEVDGGNMRRFFDDFGMRWRGRAGGDGLRRKEIVWSSIEDGGSTSPIDVCEVSALTMRGDVREGCRSPMHYLPGGDRCVRLGAERVADALVRAGDRARCSR
ncbi:hypothetical protein Tco_0134388 [Tanacetum coccineum]